MNILKVWLMNKVNQIVSKIKTKLIKPFQQLQSLVHEIKISTVYTSQNTAYLYIEYKTLLFLLFGPHLNKVKSSSLKMKLSMIQTCFILYFSFISNMSNHVKCHLSITLISFFPFCFRESLGQIREILLSHQIKKNHWWFPSLSSSPLLFFLLLLHLLSDGF